MSGASTGWEPTHLTEVPEFGQALHMLDVSVEAAEVGRLGEAIDHLHEALDALGLDQRGDSVSPIRPDDHLARDRRLVGARILLSVAFTQHELGESAAADRSFTDAERLADGQPLFRMLVYAQRGGMFLREGRLTEALDQLDRAAALLDVAAPMDQCKVLLNRGEVHGLLGNIAQAKDDSARSLELAQRHGFDRLAFFGTHNLGQFELLSGDLPRALALMPTPRDAKSDFERGVVGVDRARALLSAGLLEEADRSLVEACTSLARTDMVQFLAEAELVRAEVALLADRVELAQRTSRAAVDRLRSRDNRRATALGELIQLRTDAAAGVPTEELVSTADRLTHTFTALGLPDQARLARLVAIEHLPSESTPPRALPAISNDQPLELRLYGRLVRAQRAFARGHRAAGLRHARIGLCNLTDHQTQFGSLDLQTSSAVRAVRLAAAAIHAEMAAGHPAAVLAWVERARAVSGRVVAPQPPDDPETAELMTALRWTVDQLDRGESAGDERAALQRRRQDLEGAIRARSWTTRGSGAVAAEPRTADLRLG